MLSSFCFFSVGDRCPPVFVHFCRNCVSFHKIIIIIKFQIRLLLASVTVFVIKLYLCTYAHARIGHVITDNVDENCNNGVARPVGVEAYVWTKWLMRQKRREWDADDNGQWGTGYNWGWRGLESVTNWICKQIWFIIERQHAMHTERDIVLSNPSVCPSHSGVVSKRMQISSNSYHLLVGNDPSFLALPPLQNSKAVAHTRGWEKLRLSTEIPVYFGNGI